MPAVEPLIFDMFEVSVDDDAVLGFDSELDFPNCRFEAEVMLLLGVRQLSVRMKGWCVSAGTFVNVAFPAVVAAAVLDLYSDVKVTVLVRPAFEAVPRLLPNGLAFLSSLPGYMFRMLTPKRGVCD